MRPRAAQHKLERLTRPANRGLETHVLLQMTGNSSFQGGLYPMICCANMGFKKYGLSIIQKYYYRKTGGRTSTRVRLEK